jgi:hypothetical protein
LILWYQYQGKNCVFLGENYFVINQLPGSLLYICTNFPSLLFYTIYARSFIVFRDHYAFII